MKNRLVKIIAVIVAVALAVGFAIYLNAEKPERGIVCHTTQEVDGMAVCEPKKR